MSKQIQQPTSRIFGLDLVRSLAILLVLMSHTSYLINSSNALFISLNGIFGYAGVEMFFVLSGFLIGTILIRQFLRSSFDFKDIFLFLKRRWFRTLPNYFLILIINLILAVYLNYYSASWIYYLVFLQNFWSYKISFFSESWSLSVEEWTYILLPFSFLLLLKIGFKNSKKWLYLFVVIILIIIAHLTRYINSQNSAIFSMSEWNTQIKSIVIFRYDTILFGVILAWLNYFYTDFLYKYRVYFIIIAAHLFLLQFLILNVLRVDIITQPIYFKVFYFTLSSTTFALMLPFFIFWKTANSFVTNIFYLISKTSYSAYLLHYGIIIVLLRKITTDYTIQLSGTVLILVYLIITFLLSYLLYQFYEKPLTDIRERI